MAPPILVQDEATVKGDEQEEQQGSWGATIILLTLFITRWLCFSQGRVAVTFRRWIQMQVRVVCIFEYVYCIYIRIYHVIYIYNFELFIL